MKLVYSSIFFNAFRSGVYLTPFSAAAGFEAAVFGGSRLMRGFSKIRNFGKASRCLWLIPLLFARSKAAAARL